MTGKAPAGRSYRVKVTPKASSNRVREEMQPDGTSLLRVHVTAAPEDGKANKAVLALLADYLGVPKTSLAITRGETGRLKTVTVR